MNDKICDTCCREIPANAPGGLCPACLLRAGMNDKNDGSDLSNEGKSGAETTPFSKAPAPVPTPNELAPFFPQFEIISLLGQGGMGAVYHARQIKLDRSVALKIIRPEAATDPTFAERFSREARTLARLNHPGIVGIHDYGDFEQGFFFVMEYVGGANLRQILNEGKLAQGQSLSIVQQICAALQYAHDQGVVHRDIKPENILVDQTGRVKIADFGLARLNFGPDEQSAENKEHYFTLTGTHQVMGTPRYMAPEQIEASSRVDHRADIYSLGVVFYEMLTGEIPMGSFEPPSQKEAVDQRLDSVVLKAMAREPDRRYQQISGLANDVGSIHGANSATYESLSDSTWDSKSNQDSDPSAPSVASANADGFTAIFDRDARAVLPWVASAFAPTVQPPKRAPVTIMIACCLFGLAMYFLQSVMPVDPVIDGVIDGEMPVVTGSAFRGKILLLASYLTPTVFAVTGLMLILVPVKRQLPLAMAVLATLLSFSGLAAALLIASLHQFHFRMNPFLMLTICSAALFAMSIVALRHALASSATAKSTARNQAAGSPTDSPLASPSVVGPDWVTISSDDVVAGKIPNLCMVCGEPSTECVSRTFQWKPKYFQEIQRGNFNPLSALTHREFRLPCPTCPRHKNQRTKFILLCSTGWIVPLVLSGAATALAMKITRDNASLIGILSALLVLIPFGIWLGAVIYGALQQIRVVRIEKGTLTLDRVSPTFAQAFRDTSATP